MTTADKARNLLLVVKGKATSAAGKRLHNPQLEYEGALGEFRGHLKQAVEKVKDAFKK